jgi:hypothetical protein
MDGHQKADLGREGKIQGKRRTLREPATAFMILVWAADPTRETERPTLIAGRTPLKKSSASKKTCPSVMEMTLVLKEGRGTSEMSDGAFDRAEVEKAGVRNVSGNVTTLGLNDGESGKGSSAELVGHLGGSLEESRVQVEDISGVGLSTGRSSEKKGHLSVGNGLLRQVIVDDASVLEVEEGSGDKLSFKGLEQGEASQTNLSVVSEPLSHGATRERSQVLERSGLGGGGGDDDAGEKSGKAHQLLDSFYAPSRSTSSGSIACYSRVLHGVVLLKGLDELSDGRSLLSDSDVDTVLKGNERQRRVSSLRLTMLRNALRSSLSIRHMIPSKTDNSDSRASWTRPVRRSIASG